MCSLGLPDYRQDPHTYVSVQLVYGNDCHLLVELEHKALWAIKKLKMDWNEAMEQILNGLNELDEFLLKAYYTSTI